MAEGMDSGERAAQRPQTHKLTIQTFSVAELCYGNVRISNREVSIYPIGTPDCTCNISVPTPRTFNVVTNGTSQLIMSVYVGEYFATQLVMQGDTLRFDHNFECHGDTVVQTFQAAAPRHLSMNCRLIIHSDNLLQHMDVRTTNSVWFTAILHRRRLFQVRVNGDFFYEQLVRLVQEVAEETGLDGRLTRGVVGRVTGHGQQIERQGRPAPTPPEANQDPEEMIRPVSPYDMFVANPQAAPADVPQGPQLRGMAARINADSIRSVLQRRLVINPRAIGGPVDVSDDSD